MLANLLLKRSILIKPAYRKLMDHVLPQFLISSKYGVKTSCRITTNINVCKHLNYVSVREVQCNAYNTEEGMQVNEISELLNHLDLEVKNFQRIKYKNAELLLHFMKKGLIHEQEKYSLLLIEWCGQSMPDKSASDRISLAHIAWQELKSFGTEVGTQHYNALLKCYAANNHRISVLQFLADMGDVKPDNITYELLLECCCVVGDLKQATDVIRLMKDNNIPARETTFNSLILGHARAGNIKSSVRTLDAMHEADLLPSSSTYTALLLSYAEFGDIGQMKKVYEEAEMKNINLSVSQIMNVCRILGLKGYNKCISEFLGLMPDNVKKFSASIQNTITELLHSKNQEAALSLLIVIVSKADPASEPASSFFVFEMCRANIEPNQIINICCYLEKNELYPRALYKAAETSLNLKKPELAMQIFVTLHKNNEILRPHYFWPLFRQRTVTYGEAGIWATLKDMKAVGVSPDFDTLLDYILPVISANDPETTVQKLQASGISVRQSLTPVAAALLLSGRIESVLLLCKNYPTKIDVEKLLQPLLETYFAKRSAKSVTSFLNLIKKHTAAEDLAGRFILELLTQKKNRYKPKDIINLLQSFKDGNLFISTLASDVLTQYFKNGGSNSLHYEENIALLESMTHPDLHVASVETSDVIVHPRNMNIEELECHLVELKSKDMNTRGTLRRLLQLHVQEGNMKRVWEIKKELEESGFKISPGMQSSLFAMYIRMKDVKSAEKCINELLHQAPEFIVDEHKIIDYATLLVTENMYKVAVTVLEKRAASGKILGGESISRNCWHLLNVLAIKGEPLKVKHMLHLLKTLGFCSINNILLGPLIRAHLARGDTEEAVKEFKNCAAEFRKTPLQMELLSHLLKKIGDSPSIQKLLEEVLTVTASIHGKSNTSVTYIIALAECDKKKELQKYILENRNYIQHENLMKNARRLANENKLATLSILAGVCDDLPNFDVSVLYIFMLQVYDKQGDCDGALKLWNELQERNIQPSDKFLQSLASILKNHNKAVPFVYTQS